ncbi:hypothetical protein HanXRQr2_Chr02g0056821 [Helianthus annuus]|uniref:Uncharacterized protein n=1 Tax=Helianthus annuus TaxID=4232 RepID=A0A251VGU3_HELAN|nr:hypothetical protein HanXRQr2_Chr02g0056821 [Helianthus annuus]KAJ0951118.1 hypothetical protein HanPSC8_Chr02g0056231 [Helianthus annuus]
MERWEFRMVKFFPECLLFWRVFFFFLKSLDLVVQTIRSRLKWKMTHWLALP